MTMLIPPHSTSLCTPAWSKPHRHKTHAGKARSIQLGRQFAAIDPGRAYKLKGRVCAAANRHVRGLEQPDAQIQRGFRETPHIRRGIDPYEACFIEPGFATPVLDVDHVQ